MRLAAGVLGLSLDALVAGTGSAPTPARPRDAGPAAPGRLRIDRIPVPDPAAPGMLCARPPPSGE